MLPTPNKEKIQPHTLIPLIPNNPLHLAIKNSLHLSFHSPSLKQSTNQTNQFSILEIYKHTFETMEAMLKKSIFAVAAVVIMASSVVATDAPAPSPTSGASTSVPMYAAAASAVALAFGYLF
jgi:hypothetical protein